jgi:Domain of unknown function (DUF4177)
MAEWEYKTLRIDVSRQAMTTPAIIEKANQELADLGKEGWEMIGMVPVASAGAETPWVFCMFKRPKEQEPEEAPERRSWHG